MVFANLNDYWRNFDGRSISFYLFLLFIYYYFFWGVGVGVGVGVGGGKVVVYYTHPKSTTSHHITSQSRCSTYVKCMSLFFRIMES